MICLVRCPSPFLIDERAFPPLGLMAVGAGLKQQGHDVVVYDGDIDQIPLDYEAYGFGPTSPEYPSAVATMRRIRRSNPDARMVVGGAHVTLVHQRCINDGWDCIVVGDGEVAASDAFFSNRRIIFAEDRPLDDYPMPDRSLIDIHAYHFCLHDRPATPVMSARGCPWKCSFCSKNHNRVRMNSADRLIAEIEILHDEFGYRAVTFPEDIFILDRKRTAKVCEFLKQKSVIWRCLVRADLIVKYGGEFSDMLVDSGCVGVGMGIESGSDTILRNVNKRETVAQMRAAIATLKARGVFIKGFFILGLPGENEETLADTDRFLQEAQLDAVEIKILQPYPGSPIYEHPLEYDVTWQDIPLEHTFFKGRPGEYHGNVSTSALSNRQLVEALDCFERKYARLEPAR